LIEQLQQPVSKLEQVPDESKPRSNPFVAGEAVEVKIVDQEHDLTSLQHERSVDILQQNPAHPDATGIATRRIRCITTAANWARPHAVRAAFRAWILQPDRRPT
jgi:hypothetical protein